MTSPSILENAEQRMLFDSPHRPILIGGLSAGVFALAIFAWASMMSVASGALAPGQVAVEGNRKAVQHRDGGPIRAVFVREGQRVEKGQPLLELNALDAQAEVTVLRNMSLTLQARLARLRAEARDADAIAWPQALADQRQDLQVSAILQQEQDLFAARMMSYRGNASLLRQQIEGRQRQIEAQRGRLAATREQLLSTEGELESLKPLLEKGLISRPRALNLERASASLRGDIESIQAAIAAEESNIAQAQLQITQLERDRRESIARDISDAETRLAEVEPRLASASDRLTRSVLVAPEAGYVYGLSVFNPGAVITPGQTVLEIVPASDALVLSVEINPRNIERVRPGQTVVVHLLPYSQREQSVISGRLEKVSADRFDDKTGRSFYRGIVRIDPEEIKRAKIELVAGMPADVVIETGERSIISYLINPLFRISDFALREE